MLDTIIESVLTGKLDVTLLINWLNNESLKGTAGDFELSCCNKNEFVACFLSFLRSQCDSILQSNSNAVQILQHSTPDKVLGSNLKHHRSISDPTSEDRNMDSLTVKSDRQTSHESPSRDKKRTGRRVKTKLFTDEKNTSVSSDESRVSSGVERLALTSTPVKNGVKPMEYQYLPLASPVTPRTVVKEQQERCDTPRLSHAPKHSRSSEKSCLGDFMVNVQRSTKKKRATRNSVGSDEIKADLDLSNNAFPEIGARKSSSLRSEKRRIKPTNIDKSQKSISLNSFSLEGIQTSPVLVDDNSIFKPLKIQPKDSANGYEVERSILKQERHKLMEKFNILNTTLPPKVTPQIKITQKESADSNQSFIKCDVTKIISKDKVDILIGIYEVLLDNNLIFSVNTEIYFLISILVSKQSEEECNVAEGKLNEGDIGYLLKSINNCTYFAVKCLWHQRIVLEIILDKTSLKSLGENKKVRSFCPELAKFLLNCYGLRCEAESNIDRTRQTEARSNGVVCFNSEMDNVENFPSMLSFQSFKKQRDMFYEIVRWYQESQTSGSRVTLRSRVKALICSGPCPANQAHLCALFMQHMIVHCLPASSQESKLSKLQRRLTSPAAPESHRLPHFTSREMFYKEFILSAESESFRVHLKHAFASEIIALDNTHIAPDDRGSSNIDVSKEYLQLSKKLALLSKFLGFVTSLPYTQVTSELSSKTAIVHRPDHKVATYTPLKDKVLENDIALRNYSQPHIDLISIINNAIESGRLSITIPWLVHYLSMLDYTSLRLAYYQKLLKTLISIYTIKLKVIDNKHLKRNTIIYLKSILGWLFDLPHFPQEMFFEGCAIDVSMNSDATIDSCELVDESVIAYLCPYLRDLNVLLSTCRLGQGQREIGSYKHITPVSLSLNPEDRIKNKEKELQARLEEELLKSQPSSTRRVLELVIERITSAVVRELNAKLLGAARERAREHARKHVRDHHHDEQAILLKSINALYAEHLQQLTTAALETARASIQSRAEGAVLALITGASPPLVALAAKTAYNRLGKWLKDHWNSTSILCKDIEAEMKTLVALGDIVATSAHKSGVDVVAMTAPTSLFDVNHVSPATCIINLKEQLCLLLDDVEPLELNPVLAECAACCSPANLFGRPPTQRAILQLSVDLCVVFVSRKPKEVTEAFITKLHAIWNACCPDRKRSPPQELTLPERREDLSPHFRNFEDDERAPTPISDDETPALGPENHNHNAHNCTIDKKEVVCKHQNEGITDQIIGTNSKLILINTQETRNHGDIRPKQQQDTNRKPSELNSDVNKSDINPEVEDSDQYLEFFDRILCPRNIMLLGSPKCEPSVVWEAMATVLLFLLRNDYLSEDSLTEQCLAVYRQDWAQHILENLSTCMKSVSARWSRSASGKFTLFLDFLAEYCGNMDYESIDDA